MEMSDQSHASAASARWNNLHCSLDRRQVGPRGCLDLEAKKKMCASVGLRHVRADALWSHILQHTFLLEEGEKICVRVNCATWNFNVSYAYLPCCDRGFESHPGHGCLSVVTVVCCQVEVSATDWSLVQRSPTDCGASLCVIKEPRTRGGYSPIDGCKVQTHNGL
jgi:hypothetical protein